MKRCIIAAMVLLSVSCMTHRRSLMTWKYNTARYGYRNPCSDPTWRRWNEAQWDTIFSLIGDAQRQADSVHRDRLARSRW